MKNSAYAQGYGLALAMDAPSYAILKSDDGRWRVTGPNTVKFFNSEEEAVAYAQRAKSKHGELGSGVGRPGAAQDAGDRPHKGPFKSQVEANRAALAATNEEWLWVPTFSGENWWIIARPHP